jgi:hypothetical protein
MGFTTIAPHGKNVPMFNKYRAHKVSIMFAMTRDFLGKAYKPINRF